MALLIKSSGEISVVEPKAKGEFTLEEMQGYVGGYIEFVQMLVPIIYNGYRIEPPAVIVVNEEGKLRQLPINGHATEVAHAASLLPRGEVLVGDALVATHKEVGD